uniref:Uncharacterized protein AlNc14C305G10430 n=1 Tax=Albugo laibachii Nc14 TaxID=890382 RepID=F0WVW9_9STRA|nr:conserved hypothetical protein [Albugo laibachii Nc14]|eukprot:CCA25570.1 conserved hypothetical protein [Albugo laibachii Nc14]
MKRAFTVLLLSELNGSTKRITQLCDVLEATKTPLHAVIIAGGFIDTKASPNYDTEEAQSRAEGDMSALLSRLESLVCRVIYIPSEVGRNPLILSIHLVNRLPFFSEGSSDNQKRSGSPTTSDPILRQLLARKREACRRYCGFRSINPFV